MSAWEAKSRAVIYQLSTVLFCHRVARCRQSRATGDLKWLWYAVALATSPSGHALEAALASPDKLPSPFEVEGELAVTYFPSRPSLFAKHTTQFRAQVDHSKVLIKTMGFGGAHVAFWEFATDGTNTHFLEKREDNVIISNRYDFKTRAFVPLKTNQEPANKANLRFSTTPTPTMVGAITPPWLAYGSSWYFQSRSSGEELDSSSIYLLVLPQHKARIKDIATWTWAEQSPSFLQTLECQRLDLSVNRNATAAQAIAAFSVKQWTNLGFATFPMCFELRLFTPLFKANRPAEPEVNAIVVGTAKRILLLATSFSVSPVHQLPYSAYVVDERVGALDAKGEPLTYLAKDGTIMGLDGAKLLAAEKILKREQATPKTRPVFGEQRRAMKFIFLLLVAGLTLSMAAVLWLWLRKLHLKHKPKSITP